MTALAAPEETAEAGFDAAVVAYPRHWRAVAGALKIVSRGSLVVILGLMVFSQNPPTNPLRQMRLFFAWFAAPEVAAWYLGRFLSARARVREGALLLDRGSQTIEIPVSAIAAIEPWAVPLPRAGVSLRLRSGRLLEPALALDDPHALAEALIAEGAAPEIGAPLSHPIAVYARARRAVPPGILENPVLKFGLYSLIPTVPAHRLHQFIAYGGTFGEYYTFGLKAYVIGFLLWWVSFAFGTLCVAAGMRAAVEIVALLGSVTLPSYAVAVRRGLEILQRLAFYIGIPTWILARFLA